MAGATAQRLPFLNLSLSASPQLADPPGFAVPPPPGASIVAGYYRPYAGPLHATTETAGCFIGTRGLPTRPESRERRRLGHGAAVTEGRRAALGTIINGSGARSATPGAAAAHWPGFSPSPSGSARRQLWGSARRRGQGGVPCPLPPAPLPASPGSGAERTSPPRARPHSVPPPAPHCELHSPLSRRAADLQHREAALLLAAAKQVPVAPLQPPPDPSAVKAARARAAASPQRREDSDSESASEPDDVLFLTVIGCDGLPRLPTGQKPYIRVSFLQYDSVITQAAKGRSTSPEWNQVFQFLGSQRRPGTVRITVHSTTGTGKTLLRHPVELGGATLVVGGNVENDGRARWLPLRDGSEASGKVQVRWHYGAASRVAERGRIQVHPPESWQRQKRPPSSMSPKEGSTRVGLRRRLRMQAEAEAECCGEQLPDPGLLRRKASYLGMHRQAAEQLRRKANVQALHGLWHARAGVCPGLGLRERWTADDGGCAFGGGGDTDSEGSSDGAAYVRPQRPQMKPPQPPELPAELVPLPSQDARKGMGVCIAPRSAAPHWRFAWATILRVSETAITVRWRSPPPQWHFPPKSRISREWWDDPEGGHPRTSARELLRGRLARFAAGESKVLDLSGCPPAPADFAEITRVLADAGGCDYADFGSAEIPRRCVSPLCAALTGGGGCDYIAVAPPPVNPEPVRQRIEEAAQVGAERQSSLGYIALDAAKPRSPMEERRNAELVSDVALRLLRAAECRFMRERHREHISRRCLWQLAQALRAEVASDRRRRQALQEQSDARAALVEREAAARPVILAACDASMRRLIGECEYAGRLWLGDEQARERGLLRAQSQESWQDASLAQRARLARCRRERAELEVTEREARRDLTGQMIEAQRQLWADQNAGWDAILQRERDRAVKEEEERRRARQRAADEEREHQWRQERQKAEERRKDADRLGQQLKFFKEEERGRRQLDGGGPNSSRAPVSGLEPILRGQLAELAALDLQVTQRRERLGELLRRRAAVLEQHPTVHLAVDTAAKPGVFFMGGEDFILLDSSLSFTCELAGDWTVQLQRLDRLIGKEVRELKRERDIKLPFVKPLLQSAAAGAAAVGIGWAAVWDRQIEEGRWQGSPFIVEALATPDELREAKMRLYGGEVRCTLLPDDPAQTKTNPDNFPEKAIEYDVVRFSTPFMTVRHGTEQGSGRGVSDVSVMLPKDGSESASVVNDVLAGMQYKCTLDDHHRAYERRVAVEVKLLIADQAATLATGRPHRFHLLTCSAVANVIVHPRYLCMSGKNPFFVAYDFQEGQDDKVLLPGSIHVGQPACVERDPVSGLCSVLSTEERASSFNGAVLSVEIQQGYTRDDQVYIRRVDAGSGLGVWLNGPDVVVNSVSVGRIVKGTFRKHLPSSNTHKVSAMARDLLDTFPGDFGDDFPGQVQEIIFNEHAHGDNLHAVLDALKFSNLSSDPAEGRRVVLVSFREASQGHSTTITARVLIRGDDDPTSMTIPERRALFHAALSPDMPEGFQRRVEPSWRCICPDALVEDVDTLFFTGGHLKASITGGAKPGDSLLFAVASDVDMSEAPWHYPPVGEAPELNSDSDAGNCSPPGSPLSSGQLSRRDSPTHGMPISERIRARLRRTDPPQFRGLRLFRLPQEDAEDGSGFRCQVWHDDDHIGVATFKQLTVSEVYRQMEEAKEDTASLGQTLGQPLQGRFRALTTTRKPNLQASAHALTRRAASPPSDMQVKEIPFGFGEVLVSFFSLPVGVATIAACQDLLRSLVFRNSLLSPREGPRTVELELLVGKTVKCENRGKVRVDLHCQNELLRERVQVRVTQALLRVPPKHTDFVYLEGSGARRVAPFEVMPDEEVWVESYNGGFIHVKCVTGCRQEDHFAVRADEKEADALLVVPAPDRQPPSHLPVQLLRKIVPLGRNLFSPGADFEPDDDELSGFQSIDLFTKSDPSGIRGRRGEGVRRLTLSANSGKVGAGLLALMSSGGGTPAPDPDPASPIDPFPPAPPGPSDPAALPLPDDSYLPADPWAIPLPDDSDPESATSGSRPASGAASDDGYEDDFVKDEGPEGGGADEQEEAAEGGEEEAAEEEQEEEEVMTHEQGQALIAERLNALRGGGSGGDRNAAVCSSRCFDIVRGEQTVAACFTGKGECLVCFHHVQPPVRRKEVLQVLRNVTYTNRSLNPMALRKLFRFSLGDGGSRTVSSAFVSCEVQTVNDPTRVLLEHDRWRYRQLATCAEETVLGGQLVGRAALADQMYEEGADVPVMAHILFPLGAASLFDPDTEWFDKGTLRVELTAGGNKHDTLGFLSEKQQARQFRAYSARARAEGLPPVEPMYVALGERRAVKDAEGGGGGWEQPLIMRGLGQVGVLTKPRNVSVAGVNDLCISLSPTAATPRLSIGRFTYLLNCITYSNTTILNPPDRAAQGTRTYRARVNDGANKEDGKAFINVDFFLPIVQVPGMACTAVCQLETTAALVPKGVCNLPDKTMLSAGFIEAFFLSDSQGDCDAVGLTIPRNLQYALKDGALYHGPELFGRVTQTASSVRIDFASGSRCVDRKKLQEVLRMLAFGCHTSGDPTRLAGGGDGTPDPRYSSFPMITVMERGGSSYPSVATSPATQSVAEEPPPASSPSGRLGTPDNFTAPRREVCVRCSDGTLDQDGHLEANIIRVTVKVERARVVDRHGRQLGAAGPSSGAGASPKSPASPAA